MVAAAAVHVGGTFGRRSAQDGSTALICAAAYGHAECARLLLDAGADKEVKCNEVRASAGWMACVALWSCCGDGFVCEEACHLHFSFQFHFRLLYVTVLSL